MRPRHRGPLKVDRNQPDLVRQLKQIPGGEVIHWGAEGDLIFGYGGFNYLLEIKAPGQLRRLTGRQRELLASWPGQFDLVTTLDDVLTLIRHRTLGITPPQRDLNQPA